MRRDSLQDKAAASNLALEKKDAAEMAAWVALWRAAQNVVKPTTCEDDGGNPRLEGGDRHKGELDGENRHNATATTIVPGHALSDDDDQGTAQGCTDAQQQFLLCDSDAGPGLRRCDGYADCANRDDNAPRDDNAASDELVGKTVTMTASGDNARRDDNAPRDDNAASDELVGKTVTMTASGDNDAGTSGAGTN